MSGFQILIYVLLIYLIVRTFMNQRKYNKIKGINECLDVIDKEDEFFPKIDAYISQAKEEELKSRAEVIKLYGIVIHKRYDDFEDTLNSIQIDAFIQDKKGKPSIEEEEVSFFYLYLVLPEMLWADGREDLKKNIEDKLAPYAEQFDLELVKNISDAFNDFYENRNDRGKAFCQKIMDGDYADYYYAKPLIGLYKDLVNAVLAKIYKDENDEEHFQECEDMLKSFGETNIGKRWEMNLDIYQDHAEIDDDTEKVHAELHDDNEENEEEK